ncbi:MAG: hypothetical protein LIO87_10015 [Eubacterium sp.]|nr:hypothetical protein [Eubacterium sp.]
MAEYKNFKRRYRLAAGQPDSEGFEVGAVTTDCPVPLHITFSIEKSDLETQNTGKIEIWNLNDAHIAELEKENCIVSLRAGYGDNLSLIFSGYVSFTSTVADTADRKTTIEILDSLVEIRDTYVSLSYTGTVNWKTIFDYVASQIGVAVVYSYNAEFTDVTNGYSYVGLAKNVLSKGCECCGLTWSIQNGVLQIKKENDAISQQVYIISADTGMIESPEKVTITSSDDTETNLVGYDVTYLLNGAINVNDYVRLESKNITGYFYVYSLQISGDNETGDWLCTARLIQLEGSDEEETTDTDEITTGGTTTAATATATTDLAKGDKVTVEVSISVDTGGESNTVATKSWSVNAVNLYLTWNYSDAQINTSAITDYYTPHPSDISKTIYTYIDDNSEENDPCDRRAVRHY